MFISHEVGQITKHVGELYFGGGGGASPPKIQFTGSRYIYVYILKWVFWYPKMDGENNGKPY